MLTLSLVGFLRDAWEACEFAGGQSPPAPRMIAAGMAMSIRARRGRERGHRETHRSAGGRYRAVRGPSRFAVELLAPPPRAPRPRAHSAPPGPPRSPPAWGRRGPHSPWHTRDRSGAISQGGAQLCRRGVSGIRAHVTGQRRTSVSATDHTASDRHQECTVVQQMGVTGPGPHSPTTPATDGPMPKPPVYPAAVRGPDTLRAEPPPRRARRCDTETMPEAAPCRNLAR